MIVTGNTEAGCLDRAQREEAILSARPLLIPPASPAGSTALLVYAATPKSDVARGYRSADAALGPRGPNQYEVPFGPTLISKYAMVARRHMYEYGTPPGGWRQSLWNRSRR